MGSRLRKGEYLLLITEAEPERAPARYARRWEIETLFKACKSQGFDFESTHLTRAERIESLVALMSIALVWAHSVCKPSPSPSKTMRASSTPPSAMGLTIYVNFSLPQKLGKQNCTLV
jgi:hypothetical protein